MHDKMNAGCMPKKHNELPFNDVVQEKELTPSFLPFKPTLTYGEQVQRQIVAKGAHFTIEASVRLA